MIHLSVKSAIRTLPHFRVLSGLPGDSPGTRFWIGECLGDSALIQLVDNPNFRITEEMAVRALLSIIVLEAILRSLRVVCAIG